MSFVYLLIKLYPFFGISLTIVFFDLARNFRRKASKWWMVCLALSIFMAATSVAWLWCRGDKYSDDWNQEIQDWLHPPEFGQPRTNRSTVH